MTADDRPDAGTALTYGEVGATRYPSLPAGYHHVRHRVPVGHAEGAGRWAATDQRTNDPANWPGRSGCRCLGLSPVGQPSAATTPTGQETPVPPRPQ
jgi:hypothetical protein